MSNEDRKMRPTMGGMGQMRGMGGGKVKANNITKITENLYLNK